MTVALSHPFKDRLVLPLSTPVSSSQGGRVGKGGWRGLVSAPAREQEIESKTETDCRTIAVLVTSGEGTMQIEPGRR